MADININKNTASINELITITVHETALPAKKYARVSVNNMYAVNGTSFDANNNSVITFTPKQLHLSKGQTYTLNIAIVFANTGGNVGNITITVLDSVSFEDVDTVTCNNKTVESIKTSDGGIIYEIPKLTLSSDKSAYEEGETITITAKCTENGVVVSGQTVTYETTSATTNNNGECTLTKTMESSTTTIPITWSEKNITKNITLPIMNVSSG